MEGSHEDARCYFWNRCHLCRACRSGARRRPGGLSGEKVEPFTHLTAPRVEPGETTPGGSEMRQLCPNRLDVCQKYWAYTGYFVDGYTIPFREKEILILRTAWLSRGDYIWGRHYVRARRPG